MLRFPTWQAFGHVFGSHPSYEFARFLVRDAANVLSGVGGLATSSYSVDLFIADSRETLTLLRFFLLATNSSVNHELVARSVVVYRCSRQKNGRRGYDKWQMRLI
jgi:hypothetical protein